ncbi:MAG TPA: hypothetical protein DIS96_02970 [Pusillimonas sp.]|nr:hypothetical protein [Pusillimonas sp.]
MVVYLLSVQACQLKSLTLVVRWFIWQAFLFVFRIFSPLGFDQISEHLQEPDLRETLISYSCFIAVQP